MCVRLNSNGSHTHPVFLSKLHHRNTSCSFACKNHSARPGGHARTSHAAALGLDTPRHHPTTNDRTTPACIHAKSTLSAAARAGLVTETCHLLCDLLHPTSGLQVQEIRKIRLVSVHPNLVTVCTKLCFNLLHFLKT